MTRALLPLCLLLATCTLRPAATPARLAPEFCLGVDPAALTPYPQAEERLAEVVRQWDATDRIRANAPGCENLVILGECGDSPACIRVEREAGVVVRATVILSRSAQLRDYGETCAAAYGPHVEYALPRVLGHEIGHLLGHEDGCAEWGGIMCPASEFACSGAGPTRDEVAAVRGRLIPMGAYERFREGEQQENPE